jgi:hypothetical protein
LTLEADTLILTGRAGPSPGFNKGGRFAVRLG